MVPSSAFTPIATPNLLRRIWADQIELGRLVRQRHIELVHYPATIGPLRSTTASIVTVHDLSFLRHPEWFYRRHVFYFRFLGLPTIRRATRIIAVSQATAHDLVELLGIPASRIDVVYNGIESPIPASDPIAIRAAYGLPPSYVLYLGTVEPRKNLIRLIRAYDNVAGTCSFDLVLAGRPGWKTASIRQAAADAQHRERIHFPGFIAEKDKHAVLTGAAAFVYPSLFEGFGLPVGEALSLGVPVITSSTSSLPEVAGDAALLVDPVCENALSDALERCETDPGMLRSLAASGPSQAARFSWENCASATLDVYRHAIMPAPGRSTA